MLRREPEHAVALALQGRQIVELWRLSGLFLRIDLRNNCGLTVTGIHNRLCSLLVLCSLVARRKTVAGDFRHIKWLTLEILDFGFTLNEQCQRRRHNAPDIQCAPVQHGKQPCRVDPNKPIRTGAASRRLIQQIIVAARTEIIKALADRVILHA